MAALLKNVLISTSRARLNAQGGTTPPTPNLVQEAAHAEPMIQPFVEYKPLPAAALESDYVFRVDPGTDIVAEDVITACTLLDGVTPWAMAATNPNETLRVVYADDGPPMLLPYREAYVKRFTGGGRAY